MLWRLGYYTELLNFLRPLEEYLFSSPDYWLFLGMGFSSLRQSDDALNSYSHALSLADDRYDIYYNYANALSSTDSSLAATYYLSSLSLEPHQACCWLNLALLYQSHDLYTHSIICFKNSLLLSPEDSNIYANLAASCINLSKLSCAERAYDISLLLSPENQISLVNLGALSISTRNLEKAFSCLQSALFTVPNCPSALFNLGLCYLLQADYLNGWPLYEYRFQTDQFPDNYSLYTGSE